MYVGVRFTLSVFIILLSGQVISACAAQSYPVAVQAADFNVKCDGITDDTQAINQLLFNNSQTTIQLPSGDCLYRGGGTLNEGTTLQGMGRNATHISMISSQSNGITAAGYGSGIRSIGFRAKVTQTGGSYVILSGSESFIEDFHMDGDFNGILMTGNVARIRHGRFQDGAKDAIRIRAEGGDNSQVIDDVLMGAQHPQVVKAGIRVRNNAALIISNTSIIQQGIGLLVDPYAKQAQGQSDTGSVYSLWVHDSFFDNSLGEGVKIQPTGDASVVRSRFSNVWVGSSAKDGILIDNQSTGMVSGIQLLSIHALLNKKSGIALQGNLEDISIDNSLISENNRGINVDASINGLRITNSTIGKGAGLSANREQGINETGKAKNMLVSGNILLENGQPSVIKSQKNNGIMIKNNIGLADN